MQTRDRMKRSGESVRPCRLAGVSSRSVDGPRTGGRAYQPLLGRKRSVGSISTASSSEASSRGSRQPSQFAKHTPRTAERPQTLLQSIFDGSDRSTELHAMVREGIRYLGARSAVGYLSGGPAGALSGPAPVELISLAVLHNYTINLKAAYSPKCRQLRAGLLLGFAQRLPREEPLARAFSRTVQGCDLEGCFFGLQQEVPPAVLEGCVRLTRTLVTEESADQDERPGAAAQRAQVAALLAEPQAGSCSVGEAVDAALLLCEVLGSALVHRFEVAVCRAEPPSPGALQASATLKRYSLPSRSAASPGPRISSLLLCESRGRLFAFNTIPPDQRDPEELGDIIGRCVALLDASTLALSRMRLNKAAGAPSRRGT